MNAADFEMNLKADGYTEIETKQYDPRPANGEHGHHFSVRGLVLEGSFIVTQNKKAVTYRPGDVFSVAEGQLHYEEVGADGARILVGRKY
jgi:quercetin dioxygenase-like cupin family protein